MKKSSLSLKKRRNQSNTIPLSQWSNSEHFEKAKVFDKIRKSYYWPQMYRNIEIYIDTCYFCQTRANPKRNNELSPIEPTGSWERVSLDFVKTFRRVKRRK